MADITAWATALDVGDDDEALAVLGSLHATVEDVAGSLHVVARRLGDVPGSAAADLGHVQVLLRAIADELTGAADGFRRHERR